MDNLGQRFIEASEELCKSLWELKKNLELSLLKCSDLVTEIETDILFEDMLRYEDEEKYELANICKNELIERGTIPT